MLRIAAVALSLPVLGLFVPATTAAPEATRKELAALLGAMPTPPPLRINILESTPLDGGQRLKIEYLVEPADPFLHQPEDRVRAYLFVPNHRPGEKLPAVVAIHQDGANSHVGKSEPAGLAGDEDQHYGYELFTRGYVVICPDRFGHAERRRVTPNDVTSVDPDRDDELYDHRVGQLLLEGRTAAGKEAYDLMRATDVLCSLPYVDATRIGAIGHSAGGYYMVYFMFADERIKAGVSSCGFFELLDFYDERAPKRRAAANSLPGLARIGRSADYLAWIAPRPVLLTRGMWEWGRDGQWGEHSREHVRQTEEIERHARKSYARRRASGNLKTIYFEEGGGNHAFPAGVRKEAYEWLDKQLRRK